MHLTRGKEEALLASRAREPLFTYVKLSKHSLKFYQDQLLIVFVEHFMEFGQNCREAFKVA